MYSKTSLDTYANLRQEKHIIHDTFDENANVTQLFYNWIVFNNLTEVICQLNLATTGVSILSQQWQIIFDIIQDRR